MSSAAVSFGNTLSSANEEKAKVRLYREVSLMRGIIALAVVPLRPAMSVGVDASAAVTSYTVGSFGNALFGVACDVEEAAVRLSGGVSLTSGVIAPTLVALFSSVPLADGNNLPVALFWIVASFGTGDDALSVVTSEGDVEEGAVSLYRDVSLTRAADVPTGGSLLPNGVSVSGSNKSDVTLYSVSVVSWYVVTR